MMKAPVNKIIRFSSVDGPGNRSAIFFQGCGFHCRYCHNPETINPCNGCGQCVPVCPVNALSQQGRAIRWDSGRCIGCDRCINTCRFSSSPRIRWMSAQQVIEELAPALPFIEGITVSGGECTQQHRFLAGLFHQIHALGKTAFVDTNGQTDFRTMPGLTQAMDYAMLDIKSVDPHEHRMLTGRDNAVVLGNAQYLLEMDKLYEVRTVIVPGLLDNHRTVAAVSRMIAGYPRVHYKLLRFRSWGVRGQLAQTPSPDEALMQSLLALAQSNGAKSVTVI